MKKLFTSFLMTLFVLGALMGSASARMINYGVNPRDLYLEVGQEYQWEAYYETDDGSIREPFFYKENSADDGFELSSDGLVKGTKIGDYEVTVGFREPGVTSYYYVIGRVHVLPPVESITTSKDDYTFYYHNWELGKGNSSFELATKIVPDSYQPTYEIENPAILELSYGKLMPTGFGTTGVTVKAGTKSKTVQVSIVDKEKTSEDVFKDSPTQDPVFPDSTNEIIPTVTSNKNEQNYSVWSSPVNSYLVKAEKGYMRVENANGKVIVTYFDNDFKPLSEKTIDYELPLFGGFYNGKTNFFLVFGENNPDENDSKEVFRIVKYDKNWNRIGEASLKGANTYIPFDAGSLRMAEYKDQLYIRTSHEMYQSSDGLHHQANVSIQVDVPAMEVVSSNHVVSNSGSGYVSHSFNQFIIVDKGDIIALDHGDAYPRSALLGMYSLKAGEKGDSLGSYVSQSVIKYAGETGNNNTNASVGGLSASDKNYLTVGNSSDQSSPSSTVRNIYVSVTPKANFGSQDTTQIKWLTTGDTNPSTPHLVKFDNNNFLVLWSTGTPGSSISYVFVDENGNPKGEVKSAQGALSDCVPIVHDSKATWYVTGDGSFTVYSIDTDGKLEKQAVVEKPADIYRLYNSGNNEHLYTSDYNEARTLVARGWRDEGIGWKAPKTGKAVYRLYSPVTKNHLYTTDENEVRVLTTQKGWTLDNNSQPLFYSGGNIPVYRLYHDGIKQHHLTTDLNEYNTLGSRGWNKENIGLYALSK